MSLATVNEHVLLPHYPDWAQAVRCSRVWETTVDRALNGREARRAMRPVPRAQVSFQIESQDAEDHGLLQARLDTALRAGVACCPCWGRGIPVLTATGTTVRLAQVAWADTIAGSYVFLAQPGVGAHFQLGLVEEVSGDTLTLTAPITDPVGDGCLAWPVLFGRLTVGGWARLTDWHLSVGVTISQLASQPETPEEPPPPPPLTDPARISFIYWLNGAPRPDPGSPTTIPFNRWLDGGPLPTTPEPDS